MNKKKYKESKIKRDDYINIIYPNMKKNIRNEYKRVKKIKGMVKEEYIKKLLDNNEYMTIIIKTNGNVAFNNSNNLPKTERALLL